MLVVHLLVTSIIDAALKTRTLMDCYASVVCIYKIILLLNKYIQIILEKHNAKIGVHIYYLNSSYARQASLTHVYISYYLKVIYSKIYGIE